MVIYFILTFTCSRILRVIEDHMAGPDSYDLAMNDTLMGEGMTKYRPRPVETNADYRARQEQPETSEGGM